MLRTTALQFARAAGRWCALLFLSSTAIGQAWHLEEIAGPGHQDAQVAIGNDGAVHVIYRRHTGGSLFEVHYASKATPCSSWTHELILAAPAEGTSLAVDPSGFPHLSYYNGASWIQWGTPHHMWLDANGWHDEQVQALSCGYNTSIALDSAGDAHFLYRQEVDGSLWYRAKVGGAWTAPQVVDSGSNPGRYSVLRTDSIDRPRAAYSTWSPTTEPRYAFLDPATGWQTRVVSSRPNTYRQVSMDLDSLDRPHVLYHDNVSGSVDDLHYAVSTDGGSTWMDQIIYSPGGRYASIAVDAYDMVHVVINAQAATVKYMTLDAGGLWSQQYIADGGLTPGGCSIALDASSRPHVAYTTSDGRIVLGSPVILAHAGPDLVVPENHTVTLTGTAEGAGSAGAFSWTQIAGSEVALYGADTPNPSFLSPMVGPGGETLTFKLVVAAGSTCSEPDFVNVTVTNVNTPPVADAGVLQEVREWSQFELDGSGSFDPEGDPITCRWAWVAGAPILILAPDSCVSQAQAGEVSTWYEDAILSLSVSDGEFTTTAYLVVRVANINHAPIADAGEPRPFDEGSTVNLDGTRSSDPDGDPLTFLWTPIGSTQISLLNPTSATPSFTAPLVSAGGESFTFQLVVSDGELESAPATVEILIRNVTDPPDTTLARPSLAELWPPDHKLISIEILGVSDPNADPFLIAIQQVSQDEPIDGTGDGDTAPDAFIEGAKVLLRAERDGGGNGRVYTIHFTATDDFGTSTPGTVQVVVPHRKKGGAVDDGGTVDSTGGA